ncbi:aldehyde oxidase GLOX-like [Phragmites australis]|uniref:aldehyde oxidase GLOX-like n=1 Tax=Phragmites australis TaxID=29695 RepID=UPI002D7A33D7|nr:aldehyde oxidase GLOX-like [Phragmites australis]
MPKPRQLLPLLLLITSLIDNAGATANPWQEPMPNTQPAAFPGEWQLLHANIGVSAMHMQLLPGDFVLMFDRTDTGPSNISLAALAPCAATADGADCTAHSVLLDLRSNVLHPYPLATNPWCSSGALLPNGTLLQTGGFANGDRVARLFSPATGWTDLPSFLAARRWYATDMILPDGRVIILGGRRQFNFEFFPHDDAPALTFFPFLDETTELDIENNLYPFLHLLPDGTVFVFANDRAVVFEPYNRAPLRRLPAVPGGVPRNYPSSGSSVLLPLRPDAPAHAEVLVCGGAPRGAYHLALRNNTFVPADRTCARIAPTDPDPVWAIEEMPLARVMGDMVLLPTGDVLIVNGAAAGTAGWELGREPVTRPVLYTPDAQLGARFEVLSGTTIPRMYHSAATLDTYGRVLVGGSNPHVGYVFANATYPTELSLEAFLPPYMDSRLDGARPRVLAAPAEVGYGEATAVRFEVPARGDVVAEGPAGEVRVAAVAPAFATHSFGMNQRVVELAVGRVAQLGIGVYEAEVAAPPTPGVAPPGYYLWFVVRAGVPSSAAWVRMRPLGPAT